MKFTFLKNIKIVIFPSEPLPLKIPRHCILNSACVALVWEARPLQPLIRTFLKTDKLIQSLLKAWYAMESGSFRVRTFNFEGVLLAIYSVTND